MNHRYLISSLVLAAAVCPTICFTPVQAQDLAAPGDQQVNGQADGQDANGTNVTGGFFDKDMASKGLIDGADMGGRPKRNLSQGLEQYQHRKRLNSRNQQLRDTLNSGFDPRELQNGGGGSLGGSTNSSSQAPRKSNTNSAIVPSADGGETAQPPLATSGVTETRPVPQSVTQPQQQTQPPPEQQATEAGENDVEEKGDEVSERIKNVQRALAPGGLPVGAPGSTAYTRGVLNELNKKVEGQTDWKHRAVENRLSTEGNKF